MMGVFVQINEGSRHNPVGYIIQENGCWEWVGYLNADGYGSLSYKGKKSMLAHRLLYTIGRGPIPVGLELDHLCRKRNCVNPSHLEAVTHKENVLRGEGIAAVAARKTHCASGHPFDKANTFRRGGKGGRSCRACSVVAVRKYKQRKKKEVPCG